MGIARVSKDN